MIQYSEFTKKQSQYIQKSYSSWLNVAEGGKRAGKNIINLVAWAQVLETHPDKLHIAAGVSQSSARMNILDSDGFGLQWLFQGRCRMGKYNGRDALILQTKMGEKAIIIAGGGDARSASLIKGYTCGTAYITEVNECHETFLKEVIDRIAASHKRQLFLDLNPKPPAHWFYSEFLDYQDALKKQGLNDDYNYGHFTLGDNMSISTDRLKDIIRTYDKSSVWYQRDILGLRTNASGRIYTSYRYNDVKITPAELEKKRFQELCVGVDVGGTDATVATLTGFTPGFKEVVLIDGMYHKQGIDNKMDTPKYVSLIIKWLKKCLMQYPRIGTIYVDSANKLFRQTLANELVVTGLGRISVKPFNKKDGILDRIDLTSMLLAQGRFRIAEHMKKWHEAMQMATWTEDGFEKGEWIRTDDGSYPVDCLDSAEYSFFTNKRYIIS